MAYGHLIANLDPLELKKHYGHIPSMCTKFNFPTEQILSVLDYRTYGFTEADLEKEFKFKQPYKGCVSDKQSTWKLKDLIQVYRNAYCKNIGVEFMHILDTEKCNWIREKFESLQFNPLTREEKLKLFERINETHAFADFIAQKFNTMKRFGIEGVDAFIPGLECFIERAVEKDARTFIIGMPHRGRLNCLANVVQKPKDVIFAEFQGVIPEVDKEELHE
jgi:2-oxoglutarate dehydrogenase E1 component